MTRYQAVLDRIADLSADLAQCTDSRGSVNRVAVSDSIDDIEAVIAELEQLKAELVADIEQPLVTNLLLAARTR